MGGKAKKMRDWKQYNRELIKRGEILIDPQILNEWNNELETMNDGKEGKRFTYPKSFILLQAVVHWSLGMPYRMLEGFFISLSHWIPIKVPRYTTTQERMMKLNIDLKRTLSEAKNDFVISIDSTGVKVHKRGEWMRQKWHVRRGWIKIHVTVNNETHEFLSLEVTKEDVGDNKEFEPLIDNAIKNANKIPKQVDGDKGYDAKNNFEKLSSKGIYPGIRIRKNARSMAKGSPVRAKLVRERNKLGEKEWVKKHDLGQRWQVESSIGSFKSMMGEYVTSNTEINMVKEIEQKIGIRNLILNVAKPDYDQGIYGWLSTH